MYPQLIIMYSEGKVQKSDEQDEDQGSTRTNRSEETRVKTFERTPAAASSLGVLHPLPCLCPLSQVHSNQDLGSLPQLDDVDDILQRGDRETDQSDELWPCKALQQGKRDRDGKGNGRGHPVSEVEGNKEEFVSGTDKEECCLIWWMVKNGVQAR